MKAFKPWAAAAWLTLAATSILMKAENISLHAMDRAPLCLFRFWTGLPCPGCGMTRALLAAFQGQCRLSYSFHPLGIPFLIVWTSWLFCLPLTPNRWSASASMKLRPWVEGAALAAIFLVYAIRIKSSLSGTF